MKEGNWCSYVWGLWLQCREYRRCLFWECKKAQEVWVLPSIPFDPPELFAPDFVDFLWHLNFRQKMGDKLLELVVMVAWCLWFNCNEVRQGKARQSGSAILSKAWNLLDEFQMTNIKLSQATSKDEIQWALPDDPGTRLMWMQPSFPALNWNKSSHLWSWGTCRSYYQQVQPHSIRTFRGWS